MPDWRWDGGWGDDFVIRRACLPTTHGFHRLVKEYNPETLTFKDESLNDFVKEPVRQGWSYGEELWSALK